jgi:hypothetical protein
MTHYRDLSRYEYVWGDRTPDTVPAIVNVGWLAKAEPFLAGESIPGFAERLRLFCEQPILLTKGLHTCELCGRASGNGEIRVLGSERFYAAPVLILHYVTRHEYRPPDEFIRAVIEGPLPGTQEFLRRWKSLRQVTLANGWRRLVSAVAKLVTRDRD